MESWTQCVSHTVLSWLMSNLLVSAPNLLCLGFPHTENSEKLGGGLGMRLCVHAYTCLLYCFSFAGLIRYWCTSQFLEQNKLASLLQRILRYMDAMQPIIQPRLLL